MFLNINFYLIGGLKMNNMISFRPLSLFDSTFDSFFNDDSFLRSSYVENDFLPIDVVKSDDEFVIKASLPGYNKEDLDIMVHDGVLTIKADLEDDISNSSFEYLKRERNYSSFSRTLRLPDAVEDDKIVAELKDGVLLLTIPLAEKSKPKKINIS
mgnify:CR=1 FL=1|tara:strand:- start:18 stop:482 length:465 start_codon:yes stop_codon:yes gene_type:complete